LLAFKSIYQLTNAFEKVATTRTEDGHK